VLAAERPLSTSDLGQVLMRKGSGCRDGATRHGMGALFFGSVVASMQVTKSGGAQGLTSILAGLKDYQPLNGGCGPAPPPPFRAARVSILLAGLCCHRPR